MNTKKKNTLNEHETNEQINESTDDQANMNNETNKNINKRFKNFNEKAFLAENVNKKTMNKITENDIKVLYEFLQKMKVDMCRLYPLISSMHTFVSPLS